MASSRHGVILTKAWGLQQPSDVCIAAVSQRTSASITGAQWQQCSSSGAACNGRSSKQTAPCCLTRSSTPWAARLSGSRITMPASATGSATLSHYCTCCSATSSLPAGAPTTLASGLLLPAVCMLRLGPRDMFYIYIFGHYIYYF